MAETREVRVENRGVLFFQRENILGFFFGGGGERGWLLFEVISGLLVGFRPILVLLAPNWWLKFICFR